MSVPEAPALEARQLERVLPGPPPIALIRGIGVAVAKGEFVAVTGPSGSGKSSLLYLLGLLDRPTGGQLLNSKPELRAIYEAGQGAIRVRGTRRVKNSRTSSSSPTPCI